MAARLGFAPEGWSKESFRHGVQYGYEAEAFERIALAGYRRAALLDAIAPS